MPPPARSQSTAPASHSRPGSSLDAVIDARPSSRTGHELYRAADDTGPAQQVRAEVDPDDVESAPSQGRRHGDQLAFDGDAAIVAVQGAMQGGRPRGRRAPANELVAEHDHGRDVVPQPAVERRSDGRRLLLLPEPSRPDGR